MNIKIENMCWKKQDFAQSDKWLKRRAIQLKLQISALIIGIYCGIIYIVL